MTVLALIIINFIMVYVIMKQYRTISWQSANIRRMITKGGA